MNTHNLTKEERMRLVLEGKLSEDHLTLEEVKELEALVMDAVANMFNNPNVPRTLQ
jgi:hypothetical protein